MIDKDMPSADILRSNTVQHQQSGAAMEQAIMADAIASSRPHLSAAVGLMERNLRSGQEPTCDHCAAGQRSLDSTAVHVVQKLHLRSSSHASTIGLMHCCTYSAHSLSPSTAGGQHICVSTPNQAACHLLPMSLQESSEVIDPLVTLKLLDASAASAAARQVG